MSRVLFSALVVAALVAPARNAAGDVLRVGPDKPFKTVREAALACQDGDIIEIDSGVYSGDVATWRPNNLTVRGVGDGRAHLRADGVNEGGKGIWVVNSTNFTVENVEFSGATVNDRNGAGIRAQGSGTLTIRNCYFHDNEDGILGGSGPGADVVIENSIFERNGYGDGQSHNLYIDNVRSLTFRYNYSHLARIGHNLKSRANTNYILYNRIMDETDGTASYQIDLPNGGLSFIVGNLVQQGPRADNNSVIAYAAEGARNDLQELYVVSNTIVNTRTQGGRFLQFPSGTTVLIVNNVLWGPGTTWSNLGTVTAKNNLVEPDLSLNPLRFISPEDFDYRLLSDSPCIDGGVDPGVARGFDLKPVSQYVRDAKSEPRPVDGAFDLGAFELTDTTPDTVAPGAPTNLRVR